MNIDKIYDYEHSRIMYRVQDAEFSCLDHAMIYANELENREREKLRSKQDNWMILILTITVILALMV